MNTSFGTAKGVENGKTIILERQDESGMTVAVDTVKVENGKFEIKGKITEPSFYAIQLESSCKSSFNRKWRNRYRNR
jgi:hypothetical protein